MTALRYDFSDVADWAGQPRPAQHPGPRFYVSTIRGYSPGATNANREAVTCTVLDRHVNHRIVRSFIGYYSASKSERCAANLNAADRGERVPYCDPSKRAACCLYTPGTA